MSEQRNIVLAIILTMAILFGFDMYMAQFQPPVDEAAQSQAMNGDNAVPPASGDLPPAASLPGMEAMGAVQAVRPRAEVLADDDRVTISTPKLKGSIRLKGARFDDLILTAYKDSLEADAQDVVLLAPQHSDDPYYVEYGWVSTTEPSSALPTANSVWKADRTSLTPQTPVTLTWDNGQGLAFARTFSIDENYMLQVDQSVTNNADRDVNVQPYGLIKRTGTPEISGFFILHEGPIGVFADGLEEIDYEDLRDDGDVNFQSTGGWAGITDKYWLVAMVPDNEAATETYMVHRKRNGIDNYQASMRSTGGTIAPGQTLTNASHLFAGAKINSMIDAYGESMDIRLFDRAIDWGWLYYLTKPIFYALSFLQDYVGNFGVAILLLTVLIKLLFFQLANKSYVSMSAMRKLQPKMVALRERYADDKQKQQQEMMKMYQEEKVNPVSGCLPMLIQIPVFFALYKVLFVSIEMRQAPFFGWVQDLSAPDPLLITNLFGLIPFDPPGFLAIGVWPLLMGITMYAQQKLNPAPQDPVQAKVFMLLPIMFTFLLAAFPVGLVIYWTWNNVLTIAQQWVIMKRHGAFDND
jgi:YidC/Oxa1 family membrane protein insertase